MMTLSKWFDGWKTRRSERVERNRILKSAIAFNHARVKAQDLRQWMCPNCGKISTGIMHELQWMNGLRFPACCTRFCWHGWRSHCSHWIPDHDYPMQPKCEFNPERRMTLTPT